MLRWASSLANCIELSSPLFSLTTAEKFLDHAAAYVANATTSKALFQKIFEPALNHLLKTLNEKVTEMLTSHQKSHSITYNHYSTETLQKLRNERNQNEYSKIIIQFFDVSFLERFHYCGGKDDLYQLVTALVQRTEPDMNRFACSEALNCMEAYYKVGLPFLFYPYFRYLLC